MQRHVIAPAAMALAMLTAPVAAETAEADPVVVELFTSQGCASCPPADEMLRALARHDELIPLALHVDYWDYIGWADTFADEAFTARQEAYARQANERMVYTPQLIIGGRERVVGADVLHVMGTVVDYLGQVPEVQLTFTRDAAGFHISAPPSALDGPAMVQLVRYIPEAVVEIARGENAGLAPVYVNIVSEWHHIADWDGLGPLALDLPAEGDLPAVVILQEQGPGEVLATKVIR